MAKLDQGAFRKVLGSFATGVTIITAHSGSSDTGVTANSFNSVSLDPPLVLWSLSKASSSLQVFLQAGGFTIHILAADQEELSARFSRGGADRFAGLKFERGYAGAPLLEGCVARLQCRLVSKYEGGDHDILVGEVVEYEHSTQPPLVFHQGKYASVAKRTVLDLADAPLPAGGELMQMMSRAYHVLYAHERNDFERRKLSEEEYKILRNLAVKDRQAEPALAARLAGGGLKLTPEGLRALSQRGEIDVSDGVIALTAHGRETMVELTAVRMAIEETFFERFAREDVLMFRNMLQRIIDKGREIALSKR